MDSDTPLLTGPGLDPGLASALIDEIDQGASLWAEDGTVIHANPAEQACLGHGPGELAGRPAWALLALPADEARARVTSILTTLRCSCDWQGDWPARRRDGTMLAGRVRIRAVTEGGVRRWLCLRQDGPGVRGRGRAGAARLATRAATLGIWDWSPGTGRITLSPRARRSLGWTPGEEVTTDGSGG
jgi:PAS domain S-box-containing protein